MSHLIDVADLMADEELIIHDNTAEYERQLADLSERLDALLLTAPWLNYYGIGTGDAWPASRHKEVFAPRSGYPVSNGWTPSREPQATFSSISSKERPADTSATAR